MFRRSPDARRQRTLLLAACTTFIFPSTTYAQSGAAASEDYVVLAQNIVATGAATGDGLLFGRASAGLYGALPFATSGPYELREAVVWTDGTVVPSPPLPIGFLDGSGSHDGHRTAHLLGLNLVAGGIPAVVKIGASLATPVMTSSTKISILTPPGEDVNGNPTGATDTMVSLGNSEYTLPDSYVYLPSLSIETLGVGGSATVHLQDEQPSTFLLFVGTNIGLAATTFPIGGSFLLTVNPILIAPPLGSPTGDLELSIAIPNDPSLSGAGAQFQALRLPPQPGPIVGGYFTNQVLFQIP